MASTIVGTCLEVTELAREARVARTLTIIAMLVVTAATLAALETTVKTHVPTVTDASPVNTLTVAAAVIGAGTH